MSSTPRKVSARPALSASQLAPSDDFLPIVDTSAGLSGSKKITVNKLFLGWGFTVAGTALAQAADAASQRTALGVTGNIYNLSHGTAAGNLVRLHPTTGKLPAVDGSALINLPIPDSLPIASKAEAEGGTENTKAMSPLRTQQAITALVPAMIPAQEVTLATAQTFTARKTFKSIAFSPLSLDSGTPEWDATAGCVATLILTADATLSGISNLLSGGYILRVMQDATGGWNLTLGSDFQTSTGTALVLPSSPSAVSLLTFRHVGGTAIYLVSQVDFAGAEDPAPPPGSLLLGGVPLTLGGAPLTLSSVPPGSLLLGGVPLILGGAPLTFSSVPPGSLLLGGAPLTLSGAPLIYNT